MAALRAPRPEVAVEPVRQSLAVDRSPWWAAGCGAAAGVVLFVVVHHALVDDAYITLGYARNLAEHGHWGLLSDRSSNTQTSPLNCWLLAAGIVVTGRPVVAVGALLVATLTLIGWTSAQLGRDLGLSRMLPYGLVGLLVTSPLLVSTVGLETYLGAALLLGIARYAVVGKPIVVGALCGLAVLDRPDLAVPAGVLAVAGLWPRLERPLTQLGTVAGVAALVALPWHVFSWYILGGFLPDTTWLKSMVTEFGGDTWAAMFYAPFTNYGRTWPAAVALTVLPVAVALVCAVVAAWRRREASSRMVLTFVAAGWLHFAGLVATGAAPFTWYYGPLVVCSMCAMVLTLAGTTPRVGSVGVALLAAACAVTAGPVPWTTAPMQGNQATSNQYAAVGRQLAGLTSGQPVLGPGEIGVLAFNSAVPVVDFYGDRGQIQQWLDLKYQKSGPLLRAFLLWNWTHKPAAVETPLRYRLMFGQATPPTARVLASWLLQTPSYGPVQLVLTDQGQPS
jgi:hypothetical protein